MGENKDNGRSRYLIKNTAIFALGNVGTKMIAFFLLPLYTNALTTAQYGVVDLITTISTALAPILILNISESVMRFALDKGADAKKIMSAALLIFVAALVVGLSLIPIAGVVESLRGYGIYVYFYTATMAGSQIFLCYLRGKEKLMAYSLGNILYALSVAVLNLLYLLVFDQGIQGYFKAYIFANVIVILYAAAAGRIWEVLRDFAIDFSLLKRMVTYSAVLIPNTFMWWIMNSSNRLMITEMIGEEANGIYAIAFKIPTIATTIANVFTQAWVYSAIREHTRGDSEAYSNSVLQGLIAMLLIMVSGVLMVIQDFMKYYVDSAFYTAWRYVPVLMVGVLFSCLGTFVATSYTVSKDSKGFLFSATCGAAVHLVLSWWLIPQWGCMGAAFATAVSYFCVFLYRVFDTRKYLKLNYLSWRNGLGMALVLLGVAVLALEIPNGRLLLLGLFAIQMILFSNAWLGILKGLFQKRIHSNRGEGKRGTKT